MSSWPDYAKIQAPDLGLGAPNDVGRTNFDDGAVRQGKIYTQPGLRRSLTALIDEGRLADFRTWAGSWAHRYFDFNDPHDGATRQARVENGIAGIAYRQIATRAGESRWEITLTLEGDE